MWLLSAVFLNINWNSKKQIRTNFDLRNSSDLLRLVTRTGIGRLARRSLVVGGSDDPLGRHSTPPCSIPCFVQILIKKEKTDTCVPVFSFLVTRTGIEPVLPP